MGKSDRLDKKPRQRVRGGRREGVILDPAALKAARAERGLTQAQLAARARITSRTVGTAERGGAVSPDSARCLSAALGLPYIALLRPSPEEVRERLLERGLLPAAPPRPWAGRREETREIVRALEPGGEAALLVVSGASGMGKSALARHALAELSERFPDGVVWLSAPLPANGDRLVLLQLHVAEALRFRDRLPLFGVVDRPAFEQAFRRLLWRRRRLLVLDDVTDEAFVRPFLGGPGNPRVLVTTAHRKVAEGLGGQRLELGPLPEHDALDLVAAHIGRARLEADPEGARRLVRAFGGIPRSLQIAGRVLARERLTRPGEYAARIETSSTDARLAPLLAAPWGAPADPDASFAGAYTQLARHLPEASWDFFGALAVFEGRGFTVPWASATAAVSETDARRHLGALTDSYLVERVDAAPAGDPSGPAWFQLDAQAHRVARFVARGGHRAHYLRLLRHARAEATSLPGQELRDQVHRVAAQRAVWRQILDASTRSLGGGVGPAMRPEQLPDLAGADAEEMILFTDMLVGLRDYFRLATPPEAGTWLSVGVGAARRRGEPGVLGVLTEMLAGWHGVTRHDFSLGAHWYLASSEAYQAARRFDDAVRVELWAAEARWIAHGTAATLPLACRALELARRWGVADDLQAAALNNLAAISIHGEEGPARFDEAEALLAHAVEIDELSPAVRSTAWLNHACLLRAHRGMRPTRAATASHLQVLRDLTDDALMHNHFHMLEAFLLGGPSEAGARESEEHAWAVLTGVPPERLWVRLIKLAELVLYELSRLGWDPPPAFSADLVHGVATPEGRLGVTDAVVGIPEGVRLGCGLALIVPVDGTDRLLEHVGAKQALQFVAQVCGPEHPLHQLLEMLVLLRAATGRE